MDYSKTKYVYRDLATGRLLHERDAQQRPADSWVKEAFAQPLALSSPFAELTIASKA